MESYFFDIRKQLFEYDQVLNTQRDKVYAERRRALESDDLAPLMIEYAERTVDDILEVRCCGNFKKMCGDGHLVFVCVGLLRCCSPSMPGLAHPNPRTAPPVLESKCKQKLGAAPTLPALPPCCRPTSHPPRRPRTGRWMHWLLR